jgi:hypothetical protein
VILKLSILGVGGQGRCEVSISGEAWCDVEEWGVGTPASGAASGAFFESQEKPISLLRFDHSMASTQSMGTQNSQ